MNCKTDFIIIRCICLLTIFLKNFYIAITLIKGCVFFFADQVDSLFGVAAVFALLFPMTLPQYFFYILLGAATHIAVNSVLYAVKIRRNL